MIKLIVKVVPGSKFTKVEKISESEYKVYVRSPPVKGKANQELLEVLSQHFSVPKSKIKIKKGFSSRTKIIKIE